MEGVKKSVRGNSSQLLKSLKIAANEKDVENAYRQAFSKIFPGETNSPFRTDGMIQCPELTSILEFKSDVNLKIKLEQAIILVQVLWYLKKMEKSGAILPKSIFIGDKNECMCLPVSCLTPHLVRNGIDLSVSASKASSMFPEFVKKLAEDAAITPFVYNIDEKFNFRVVVHQLLSFQNNEAYYVQITKENIGAIFEYFRDNVITDKALKAVKKGTADIKGKIQLLADVFFNCLTDKTETYLHPVRKNVLVTKGNKVSVNNNLYNAFLLTSRKNIRPQNWNILLPVKTELLRKFIEELQELTSLRLCG